VNLAAEVFEDTEEKSRLARFRSENADLFQKNDLRLYAHLGIVLSILLASTAGVVTTREPIVKILLGVANALLCFSLINATLHHHHTHHNAAAGPFAKCLLDFFYLLFVPNAPRRLGRYTRSHLNHHARPFHETDVDHYYGKDRYLAMMKNPWTRILYFLELTFVGGHVPGWEDDRYMNQIPLEEWNRADYERVKEEERKKALGQSLFQWGLFAVSLWLVPAVAWGWAFPMLLVKNWAHFLGQFQHYDDRLLDPSRSVWNRTKTYHFPPGLNYLVGGEISGHFLHHLFPELPYYNVEEARRRLVKNPELSKLFVTY
jgi:fatty acid desaturase